MILMKKLTRLLKCSNDDKRMQLIDSIEPHAYGARKYLVSEKEKIKCSNIKQRYKND